jgi:hypothetical protein
MRARKCWGSIAPNARPGAEKTSPGSSHAARLSAAFLAIALAWGTGAQAQAPQGCPADYTKIIEAAKKEGKVVIYATTDAVAAIL